MDQPDSKALKFLKELSVAKQMKVVIEAFPNNDEEHTDVPKCLPKYLMEVFDKTRKLAIPAVIGSSSNHETAGQLMANDLVVSIIWSVINTSHTIINVYKAMNNGQRRFVSKCESGFKDSIEEKFVKLDAIKPNQNDIKSLSNNFIIFRIVISSSYF